MIVHGGEAMIDHVSVPVRDLAAAAAFYQRLLAPLGYARLVTRSGTIGFGKKYPELWLNLRRDLAAAPTTPADTSPCAPAARRRFAPFMRRRWPQVERARGSPGPVKPRGRPTSARSSSIRTATNSRPSLSQPRAHPLRRPHRLNRARRTRADSPWPPGRTGCPRGAAAARARALRVCGSGRAPRRPAHARMCPVPDLYTLCPASVL